MADLSSITTKKVGPWPVPVWVGVIGVGAAIGYVIRRRTAGGTTTKKVAQPVPAEPTTAPYVAMGANAGASNLPAPSTAPSTNSAWVRQATDLLVAEGQDPSVVASALTKFVDGKPLTSQEVAVVNMAIRRLGAPPDGAPPITTTGGSTTPGTAPADLRSLGSGQLINQASAVYATGSGYEPYVQELTRRVIDRQLSVNDPAWKDAAGRPVAIWYVVAPLLNGYLAGQGARYA